MSDKVETQSEPEQPAESTSAGTTKSFPTEREGVFSATEGGVPDPTVHPGGGTVTDPIPGAQPAPAAEPEPEPEPEPPPAPTTTRRTSTRK